MPKIQKLKDKKEIKILLSFKGDEVEEWKELFNELGMANLPDAIRFLKNYYFRMSRKDQLPTIHQ